MYQICVVTATRAEYGLLRRLISLINQDPEMELRLIVTGAHLSDAYGKTVREIEEDGFPISEKIDLYVVGESAVDVADSMAIAQREFTRSFERQKPDMVVVLGDRYELIPICSAAMISSVPVVHISGGEITTGAMDDVVRHCVTKMSYLHFPACQEYRNRIIQLGEAPERVFDFGDIGLDALMHMDYLSQDELEAFLKVKLDVPYAVVTYHPVTMEAGSFVAQVTEMLEAMKMRKDITFIITKSNADMGGKKINEMLQEFCSSQANCHLYDSLGIKRYISLLKDAAFMLGNSSSGLYEAPAFRVPTINIGNRQAGRIKLKSVLDCRPIQDEIMEKMNLACDKTFRDSLKEMENPFVGENTVERMLETMKVFLKENKINLQKRFYDL